MVDKCEICSGRGFVFGTARSMWVLACEACRHFGSRDELRAHILLCCESHDELVAACGEAANLFDELLNTRAMIHHTRRVYDLAASLHARVAKAQPTKEPTPTQGDSNA